MNWGLVRSAVILALSLTFAIAFPDIAPITMATALVGAIMLGWHLGELSERRQWEWALGPRLRDSPRSRK